jgi:phage shock protein PspC (stress-responsive transcriptional regulator)
MKKTININLGGHPIIIDEDAFQQLETYLSRIGDYFSNSEGREEIVTDIETRIAELFQQELKGKKIVSSKEVQKVIEIMGVPEHFGGEEPQSEYEEAEEIPKESKGKQGHQKKYQKTGKKRLFRDPSDKVIGGVASGLSAYFGIDDPVWLRIVFVLLFFTTGVGLLAYIIMWIIVPKAKSASDRLSMHGDPINVDSIAHNIEEDISDLSNHVKKFGQDMKKKYGSDKNKRSE